MGRGRLLQKFKAVVCPLDTSGIQTAGRYDKTFRAVRKQDSATGIGTSGRVEGTPFRITVQVEPRGSDDRNQSTAGDVPEYDYCLVAHFRDLELMGKVDADGTPSIRLGDRVSALEDIHGNVVQSFSDPPGLYVVAVRSSGFGIDMANPKRNLCLIYLRERATGVAGT